MYCIIALPRTASTSMWQYVNTSLVLHDPKYLNYSAEHCEPFNPKYNLTVLDQHILANTFIDATPPPVIKILTSQTYEIAFKFINNSTYKTIFLEPNDLKQNTLKTLLMWGTKNLFGPRISERSSFVGKIDIEYKNIRFVLKNIKRHLAFKNLCDYKFTTNEIINSPNENFLQKLGLPAISKKNFMYTPPYYGDIIMLKDVHKFEEDWNRAYREIFGETK